MQTGATLAVTSSAASERRCHLDIPEVTGTIGNYNLTATASAKTTTSSVFQLRRGHADRKLVFSSLPTTAFIQSGVQTSGTTVSLEDVSGNINNTAQSYPVTLTSSKGTLAGTSALSVNGVATFNWTLTALTGSFTLTATSSGLSSVTSSSLTLAVGPAASLAFATQPGQRSLWRQHQRHRESARLRHQPGDDL